MLEECVVNFSCHVFVTCRVLGQIWQLVKEPERDRDELVWKPCHLSDVHLKLTLVEVGIKVTVL